MDGNPPKKLYTNNVHNVHYQPILNPFMLMQNRQEEQHAIKPRLALKDTKINAYSIDYGFNSFDIRNKIPKSCVQ